MKICKRCMNTMPEDAIYCNQCGGELVELKGEVVCKNCYALNDANTNFCKSCGAPLKEGVVAKKEETKQESIEELEKGYASRVKSMAGKIGVLAYAGVIIPFIAFIFLLFSVLKQGSIYKYIVYMQGDVYCQPLFLNIWLIDIFAILVLLGSMMVLSLVRVFTFKANGRGLAITLSLLLVLAVALLWFSYIYCHVGIEKDALINAIKTSRDYLIVSGVALANLILQVAINPKEIVL